MTFKDGVAYLQADISWTSGTNWKVVALFTIAIRMMNMLRL